MTDVLPEPMLRDAIEKAFDYRGNVVLTLKSGEIIEGYLFDRRPAATLEASIVRIIPKDTSEKRAIAYAGIATLQLDPRDPAAGKSWEAWVRKYWERKAMGESGISLEPDSLD